MVQRKTLSFITIIKRIKVKDQELVIWVNLNDKL